MTRVRFSRAMMLAAAACLVGAGASAQTVAPPPDGGPTAGAPPSAGAQPAVPPAAGPPTTAPSEQAANVPPGAPADVPPVDLTADWPCVQRKVVTLTASQMWDGPSVEGLAGWNQEAEIQRLIPILTSRRIPLDEATAEITKYAESLPEGERDSKLTLLFAGLLDEINRTRASVVNGLETFQKRQRLRSSELEREGVQIAELQGKGATDPKAAEELAKATELYNWNARIFQERQRNMPLACEIPVLIEQRIYELARAIRSQMKS